MNKRVAVRFGFVAALLLWIALTQLASADDLVSLYLPLITNGGHATPSSTPTRTAPSSPTPTSTASATPTLPASTPTATATQTTTPGPCAGNGIVRSVWTGISGSTVNDLIVGTNNFSLAPTVNDILPSFEAPANWNDNYGTLMTAWLCVPITSTYRFWIASDDNSSLLFNTTVITDLSTVNIALIAAGATEIAFVSGWTNSREWNKYPEQQSSPFALPPGWYYLEARHKEAVGGDNLAVAWREGTPAPPANGDGSFIIPQAHLYVIVGFSGTTDTPTPTATHTVTATSTPTGTATRTPTPTGATATPTPTNTATRTPSLTPSANCVTGMLDVSLNTNALQILFTNSAMPPINRRLTGLSISWSGAQMITSLSFGNAGNLIWVGGSAGGSLVLGESDWQSSNRTILTGTSRPFTINFDQSAFPGNYTLSATWDDGAGGNLCTSPAVNTP